MTSQPDDDRAEAGADAAALLAEMRAGLDAATAQVERVADELDGSRARLDLLETAIDILLGHVEAVVVVVDADRNILGMSAAAVDRLGGPAIGKPLTSVLPEPLADNIRAESLPGGAAVLVVTADD
ncbi:MAG: hypothetical protein PV358_02465 [Acidimicrobiales bacterium]|nr:hypothetical protein [Acidimicrobiales bacterium]